MNYYVNFLSKNPLYSIESRKSPEFHKSHARLPRSPKIQIGCLMLTPILMKRYRTISDVTRIIPRRSKIILRHFPEQSSMLIIYSPEKISHILRSYLDHSKTLQTNPRTLQKFPKTFPILMLISDVTEKFLDASIQS